MSPRPTDPRRPAISALATDLYEITMAAGYYAHDLVRRATFELFVRVLPKGHGFLVAAGLEQALDFLARLRFTPDEIEYLRTLPNLRGVSSTFFDTVLPSFRFTGDVWAVEEGTPIVPPAPLLRVDAPLPEAQIVETALLSTILFQTAVATRAARLVAAADGRAIVEFGARRAHGTAAAALASRAAFIGGCEATSNVEAGFRFGIPLSGTMAHSWVTGFPSEREAFEKYVETFGSGAVLLLDTYDTVAASRLVVDAGFRPAAVRLDSGDLGELARVVRAILDGGGLRDTKILASGDLDEERITALARAGAPIDGFGVGAAISTVSDAPPLGGVYKLVEIERAGERIGVAKLSPDKQTWPGRKQVWRVMDRAVAARDVIALDDEEGPEGARPLLRQVMARGARVTASEDLAAIRSRTRERIAELPDTVRRLENPTPYPVQPTERLRTAIAAAAGGRGVTLGSTA